MACMAWPAGSRFGVGWRWDLATGEQREPSEQMCLQRQETIAWLRDIANGNVVLELDEVAPGDESYAQASTRPPVYGGGGWI